MKDLCPLLERCAYKIETRPVRSLTLLGLLTTKVIANANLVVPWIDTSGLRGVLPDPVDVINHSGNVTSSVIAALAIGFAARKVAEKSPLYADGLSAYKDRIAVAAGTLAAVGVSAVIESVGKFTADPYDFAYGVGAGIIAATMLTSDHAAETTE